MKTDEPMFLLDDLQSLLEKQIELARKSNFRRVEALADRSNSVIEEIAVSKQYNTPQFSDQRKHIADLHKKFQLILTAGKDTLSGQLKQIGNVRKTLKAYRNSG